MSDYIKREDALTIIERLRDRCGDDAMAFALNWALNIVEDISVADVVERKTGFWEETEMSGWDGDIAWVCSACGEPWTLIEGTPEDNYMRYCPMCGAEMTETRRIE